MNQDSLPVLAGTSTNLRQRQQPQPCSESRTQEDSSSSQEVSLAPLRNERQQDQRRITIARSTPLGRPTTRRRRSKRKTLQEWAIALIKTSFYLGMNAAVTIFGLGVGVGLVLGDSLRASMTPQAANDGSTEESLSSTSSTTNWTLEPSCGGGATRRPRLVRQTTAVAGDSRPLASSSIPGGGLPAQ